MPTSIDTNQIGEPAPTDGEFEELAIAEEELIDAYLRNELPPDERSLFQNALVGSPRLRERLHFAKLLAKEASSEAEAGTVTSQIDQSSPPSEIETRGLRKWRSFFGPSFMPQPAFRQALGACLILILLGGAALLAGWMGLRRESQRLAAERVTIEQERQALERNAAEQRSRSEQQTAELAQGRQQLEADRKQFEDLRPSQIEATRKESRAGAASVATLFLPAVTVRSGAEPAKFDVRPGVSALIVQLGLQSLEYRKYQVIIKNAQKSVVLRRDGLKPISSTSIVSFKVPASSLPLGNYTIELSGIASSGSAQIIGAYPFSISHTPQ